MPFTVAQYVLTRLREQGVDTLFGVPAAYCSPLFDAAGGCGITAVVTASDLEAGYAADGYARTRGLGAVSTAYGVGTLSMVNAIAGAHVERSPVVVVNGGPTARHLDRLARFDVVFSHSTGRPDTDLAVYGLVTASAARAGTVAEVPAVVDGAIAAALTRQRPVYVEIDMDLWRAACPRPAAPLALPEPAPGAEQELAATVVGLLRAATAPALLVGTEVQRYGLADQVAELIGNLGLPWCTALLAKSALAEEGQGWVGVYNPPNSAPAVTRVVEQADLLLTLGCVFPNGWAPLVTTGSGRIVSAYDGTVRLRGGPKQAADLRRLVAALVAESAAGPRPAAPAAAHAAGEADPGQADPGAADAGELTYARVFGCIGAVLDETWLAVPDTLLGIASAANLPVAGRDAFLCSAVWASIGHSVAAAVGASFGSGRRPLVVCGDGGFRMTAQALSTMARYGRDPVVVVVENGIYAYEQYLVGRGYFADPHAEPEPYVALDRWDLVAVARGLGVQCARSASTVAEFQQALADAQASPGPALVVARVDPHGLPAELA